MNITWVTTTESAKTRVNNYEIHVKNVKQGLNQPRRVYNVSIIRRDNRYLQYERDILCDSLSFAMMEAHRIIELNPDKFISPNFSTLKKSIKGYKAVLVWNSNINHFHLRVIEVRIPKGTIVHNPKLESIDVNEGMFKYRAQDAVITSKFASYEKGLSLFIGEMIAQAYPQVLINNLVINLGDHVKGYYSTGMKVHIPDFSWYDAECAAGFHFFTSKAEAERYLMYYYPLATKLNVIIAKEANNG